MPLCSLVNFGISYLLKDKNELRAPENHKMKLFATLFRAVYHKNATRVMTIEIIIASVLLFLLTILASVDMAFSQLSDVSLRRLFSETGSEREIGLD